MKISKKAKAWLILLICIEAVFWFTTRSIFGIIHTDGPYFGRVVDAEDGKPIEGAAVANVWDMEYLIFPKTFLGFGDAIETMTDTEGKYYLPRIWTYSLWPLSKLRRPEILVFKAGYDSHPPKIQSHWASEDEKERGMTRHEYQLAYWVSCEPETECLVQLNEIVSQEERKYIAYYGISKVQIPQRYRMKLKNIIKKFNNERNRFNLGLLTGIE